MKSAIIVNLIFQNKRMKIMIAIISLKIYTCNRKRDLRVTNIVKDYKIFYGSRAVNILRKKKNIMVIIGIGIVMKEITTQKVQVINILMNLIYHILVIN